MSVAVNLRSEVQRSQSSWYSHRYLMVTRYVDLDDQNHVNNVAVLALFGEARLLWLRELAPGVSEHDFLMMCGALRARRAITEYLVSGQYPAPVEAGLRVERVGADGLRLSMALFQSGACIALQDCELGYAEHASWSGLPAVLSERISAAAEPGYVFESRVSEWQRLERYPLKAPIQGRYSDMDSLGYIGETAACRMLEASRFDFLVMAAVALKQPMRVVIGRLVYEPQRMVRVYGGDLVGTASVTQLGRSSIGWQSGLFRGDDCVALLDVTQIYIGDDQRPRPLPEVVREMLAGWMKPVSA
jgi:acyl-CoA thioester hydrolase